MNRLDNAYKILGISETASDEEIRAAYEELRHVWDPSRFENDPKMLAKAKARLSRIDEAYRLLRLRGRPRVSPPSHPWLDEKQKKKLARFRGKQQPKNRSHRDKEGSPSLFDDAFSERISTPANRVPRWVLTSAILLVSLIVLFILIDSEPVQTRVQTEPMANRKRADSSQGNRASSASDTEESVGKVASVESQPPTGSNSDQELQARTQPSDASSPPSSEIRGQETTGEQTVKERPQLLREEPLRDEHSSSREELLQANIEDQGIETPRAEKAFLLLKEESQAARELLSDQVPGLQFVTWKALPKEADELWIDLTAEDLSSGESFHFIWAVDPTQQRVRPMSQAARNLELGRSRM